MAYTKRKKFRIYRVETNGSDVYCTEESTRQEAEKSANKFFSERPNSRDQVFVQEEREILRICSKPIGFRT